MEYPGYLRIHGDHVVSLDGHTLVPSADLGVHPVLEVLPHDGVDDIRQISPAELLYLLAGRQGPLNVSIVLGECKDVLDGEALELRNVDDLDVVTVDDGLDSHGKVPQVPDGDRLVARQVSTDLGRKESVYL